MKPKSIADDPDMQKATTALIRAAKRARQIAQQTGTAIVVVRDGELVREITPPVSKKRTKKKSN
ncbi:MAG: hypothetical protein ACRD3W_11030 [Terriglobales bacterium]